MKKPFLSFLLGTLLIPAAALAADFEGTVTMKMSGKEAAGKGSGSDATMNLSLKGGLTRVNVDARGSGIGVIMDPSKQQMTILMEQQRAYMVQPLPAATVTAAVSDKASGMTLEKSGQTEKILGYDCTKYVAQDKAKNQITELWVTEELGAFMGFGGGGGPMGGRGGPAPQGWETLLQGKNFFPMRVISTANGKEVGRVEVTAVDKKSLPDSLFTVPDGWRDLSAMMRGMGGLPGGRPPGGN
jgi:hypothetical protein